MRQRSEAVWAKGLVVALVLVDSAAVTDGLALAYLVRFKVELLPYIPPHSFAFYASLVFGLIPAWLIFLAVYGLYDQRNLLGGLQEYARVLSASAWGIISLIMGTFVEPSLVVSRGWVVLAWLFCAGLLVLARFAMRRVVYVLRRRGHFLVRTILVGTNREALSMLQQFRSTPTSGVQVVGFVDPERPAGVPVADGLAVLGRPQDLPSLVAAHGVDQVVLATSGLPHQDVVDVVRTFASSPVEVRLSPGIYDILTTGLTVKEIGFVPLVSANKMRITGADAFLKAALDRTVSALLLISLLPLLVAIAVLVKRDSPGPIFHRRRVLGQGNRPFDALKFRTMVANADQALARSPALLQELQRNGKLRHDPRVTRVGRSLRRTSLDELPQLINVLRGQMSLVGPRMIAPEEAEKYGRWQQNLLTVKPGITGIWQVSGRSDLSYEERVRLDMHYIRNHSLWLDLYLLWQTVPAVLKGRGAY